MSDGDYAESKAEQMLQLRLHNYYGYIRSPYDIQSPQIKFMWRFEIPEFAFNHENLLFALLSISASRRIRDQQNNAELQASRDRYHAQALQAQRRAIDEYGPQNAESIYFSVILLMINTFALLGERLRPNEDCEVVIEWLKLGCSCRTNSGHGFNARNEILFYICAFPHFYNCELCSKEALPTTHH